MRCLQRASAVKDQKENFLIIFTKYVNKIINKTRFFFTKNYLYSPQNNTIQNEGIKIQ